jgi:hypothetical protein
MGTCHLEWTTGAGGLLVLAIMLLVGSAVAQDRPVLMDIEPDISAQAQAVLDYWTPERMRRASPKPFPAVPITGAEVPIDAEAELPPDAYPGFAQGWRPGLGSQPDSDSRIDITPDHPLYESLVGAEQPQTSPPFSSPGNPTDFGNHAPFNRFTWHAGAY